MITEKKGNGGGDVFRGMCTQETNLVDGGHQSMLADGWHFFSRKIKLKEQTIMTHCYHDNLKEQSVNFSV